MPGPGVRIDRDLSEMPLADREKACNAVAALVKYRRFLPLGGQGGLLLDMAERWRDDVRESIPAGPIGSVGRGSEYLPLDQATSGELGSLSAAVTALLGWIDFMDDPGLVKLLDELAKGISSQQDERRPKAARSAS
jgi:hypothetical protein